MDNINQSNVSEVEEPEKLVFELVRKIQTIVGNIYRSRKGQTPIDSDPNLDDVDAFYKLCFDKLPDESIKKLLSKIFILGADNGFTASTFVARAVVSTESDITSAFVASICSAKGPLHGGASEDVLKMLEEIDDPSKVEDWIDERLSKGEKIFGFGHRVYKGDADPRYASNLKDVEDILLKSGKGKWLDVIKEAIRVMRERKNLHPNAELALGPIMSSIGFEKEFIPLIMFMMRSRGIGAHVLEQMVNNKIIRPASKYTGGFSGNI